MNKLFHISSLLLIVMLFSASSMLAQDVNGTFTLPITVTWGAAVLQPGDYTFHLDANKDRMLAIHTEGRTVYVLLGYTGQVKENGRRSELVTTSLNQKDYVNELYVASMNTSYYFGSGLKAHVSTSSTPQSPKISKVESPDLFTRIPVTIAGK